MTDPAPAPAPVSSPFAEIFWALATVAGIIILAPFWILYKTFNHTKKSESWYHKFVWGALGTGPITSQLGLSKWGISRGLVLSMTFIGLFLALAVNVSGFLTLWAGWFFGLAPLWLPAVLAVVAGFIWVHYVREKYISGQDFILLEIKMPREITKSPRAMELVLMSIGHGGSESYYHQRAWKGQVRTWFSLEVVSLGGSIHYYIWTAARFRSMIEAAFYAQFPEVEIVEVPDYAKLFEYDPAYNPHYFFDYRYVRKDTAGCTDTYQVKSYIDFELDKDPKEEFKIDPMAQWLEFMSSAIKSHEQIWMQILIRTPGNRNGILTQSDPHEDAWRAQVAAEINQIKFNAMKHPLDDGAEGHDAYKGKESVSARLTPEQQDQIKHLERHRSKYTFEVAMRTVYFADTRFGPHGGWLISVFRDMFRTLNSKVYNSLGAKSEDLDFPWQDPFGNIGPKRARRFFEAYLLRSAFYPPYEVPTQIMTVEALATLFHFPSSSIKTPGIERIPAKKAEPPNNLPM